MKKYGLLVKLKAKEGKEMEVLNYIQEAVNLARREHGTISWYSFRIDKTTFGIFDSFENEEGREAHLNGEITSGLMERAQDLLIEQPEIEKVEILSAI